MFSYLNTTIFRNNLRRVNLYLVRNGRTNSSVKNEVFSFENTENDTKPSLISEKSKDYRPIPALLPGEIEKLRIVDLNKTILNAENLDILFNIYLQNKSSYEISQYLNTTRRLSELFKIGKISSSELHTNEKFQLLCYEIYKLTSQMESTDVLNFYRHFIDLKVSTNYLIMQSLLQMVRHQINLLTIKDLIFLDLSLRKTESCNLKDALWLALPRVMENCIKVYFPSILKYSQLTQLLQICIDGEVQGISLVLNELYTKALPKLLLDKDSDTFYLDIISLLLKLMNLFSKKNPNLTERDLEVAEILMINCFNELVENELKDVDQRRILLILRNLAKCKQQNDIHDVFETFHSIVATKSIAEKWDLKSLCTVLDFQMKMHYVDDVLVDNVLSHLKEDTDEVTRLQINIPSLISALAATNLPQRTHLLDPLLTKFTFQNDNLGIAWIRLALNLLSLNSLPVELMNRILDKKFLFSYLSSRQFARRELLDLLRLDRTLKALRPEEGLEMPLELVSLAQRRKGPMLIPSLQIPIENNVGEGYLRSNVITPLHNVIDHLIIVNKHGQLTKFSPEISTNLTSEFCEMTKRKGDRKIAVLEVPESWMCRPGLKLRGSFSLEIKLIQDEGFEVVPLYQREIDSMKPEEIGLYIRNKLDAVRIL